MPDSLIWVELPIDIHLIIIYVYFEKAKPAVRQGRKVTYPIFREAGLPRRGFIG